MKTYIVKQVLVETYLVQAETEAAATRKAKLDPAKYSAGNESFWCKPDEVSD